MLAGGWGLRFSSKGLKMSQDRTNQQKNFTKQTFKNLTEDGFRKFE